MDSLTLNITKEKPLLEIARPVSLESGAPIGAEHWLKKPNQISSVASLEQKNGFTAVEPSDNIPDVMQSRSWREQVKARRRVHGVAATDTIHNY